MVYRAEIDGLRAIAVIPVILFHAGFVIFSGGFVGVDVFFVISGYLITSIIIQDQEAGKFSLVNFYERRARRILPALFLVMAVSLPFAWMWLLPEDLKDFSESIAAVSTFSSNLLFWQERGYFDTAAELKPLLHTWSLAVEEQYYVLFPLFLMLAWAMGKRWIIAILSIGAFLSLGLAEWGSIQKPTGTFYLLPTRAWELLLGVLLAFYLAHRPDPKGNQILSAIGLLMVLYAIFAFDHHTPFPSLYTVIPTVGVALIILFATSETVVCRLLSNKVLVGIGLISYSAYLWHQPIFAFAKHISLVEPPPYMMLIMSIASIGFAYLSWRYVEKPFRNRSFLSTKKMFALSFFVSLSFVAVGLAGSIFKFRDPPHYLKDVYEVDSRDESICHLAIEIGDDQLKKCLMTLPGRKVVLLGDSHAASLSKALRERLQHDNIGLITFSYDACAPILTVAMLPIKRHRGCFDFKEKVYGFLAKERNTPIVLSARWTQYITNDSFDNLEGGVEKNTNGLMVVTDRTGSRILDASVSDHIRSGIVDISRRHPVILVSQIPEAGWSVPRQMHKYVKLNREIPNISTSYSLYKSRNKIFNRSLKNIKAENVSVVHAEKVVCDKQLAGRCVNYFDGRVFYTDDDHPSYYFSRLIAEKIVANVIQPGN